MRGCDMGDSDKHEARAQRRVAKNSFFFHATTMGRRKPTKSTAIQQKINQCKPLQPKDLKGLSEKLQQLLGYKLRNFQMQAITKQLCGKDVVVHAGTCSGKTAIAAAPHLEGKSKGMVTIFVSPLIALQNEQVCGPFLSKD